METHLAYCAALDREVRVILRPVSWDETDPDYDEVPGIVCLEHAEDCQGILCPLFDLPLDAALMRFEWFSRRRSR